MNGYGQKYERLMNKKRPDYSGLKQDLVKAQGVR